MSKHTVKSYDAELESLRSSLIEMLGHASQEVDISLKCWHTPDVSFVAEARELDKKVNAIDQQIEQKATSLLALRQPMGIDLRMIVSALKLVVLIERIGDLAKNTAKRACNYNDPVDSDLKEEFTTIINKILQMSVSTENLLKLEEVDTNCQAAFDFDDEIDILTKLLIQKTTAKISATQDKLLIEIYLNFIFAIKNIERIGDCLTKIARIMYYIKTGDRMPKHHYRGNMEEH
ncbi:MAG: phosphate signaling complex protein PhoU [Alphaproteobacteria bacterium]|nr:phosphate signaling complex protein PhoU [Alphaproteobacteria bacterium]OJV13576.1 MAG: phosphate transport system regulatory protein PhoU [Alphaproteobacteria bacterium 33-17]